MVCGKPGELCRKRTEGYEGRRKNWNRWIYGHDPELFCDSIENNIRMGDKKDITPYLRTVCFEKEVDEMDQVLWLENGCVQDHQHPCCDLVP